MKNLFKNLMLVAVAAMAFTACSQDVNEVNKIERVTRYEFTANIADDTRSGFAEKEDGATAYKSEWFGDETLKLFLKTNDNSWSAETTASIDEEGMFSFKLENAPESFFMTVVSPAESWESEYTANIPAVQTPLANSVDPKAHLLQAQAVPVSGGVADINMTHMAAYGKMTVNGVAFEIDHVVIDLKGSFFGSARELSYTINAANVENNTFWFATEPIDVAEFTVTAYDAEGNNVVAKTVSMEGKEKPLAFNYGRVGTFSVKDLEVPAVPEETYDYTSAYVSNTWGDDDKLITFTAEGKDDLNVNFAGRSFDGNAIAAGTYYYDDGVYNYGISLGSYYGAGGLVTAYHVDSVSVSIENNNYVIIFTNLRDQYSNSIADRLTFKGTIGGLEIPDPRTSLDVPTNVKATVSGKTITLTWNPVDNVDGYKVWMFSPDNEAITEIVKGTQYVFEAQKANTTYNFNVYSYASDENPTYKTSTNWAYVTATTEDTDPKMEVSESMLSFSADGGVKTFNVTLKNTDAEITYTQEGDWFSVEMSGNTFTVTAEANESETDARDGSITVTAGELSQPITITQSKKSAEVVGDSNMKDGAIVLNIVNHGVGYSGSSETEIIFIENNGYQHVIDFSAFKSKNIVEGYFTTDSFSQIIKQYCKFRMGSSDGNVEMSYVEAWVKANGDGTYNFEINFQVNSQWYYINYDLSL